MKRSFMLAPVALGLALLLPVGIADAQAPRPGQRAESRGPGGFGPGRMFADLNLTPAQKTKVEALMREFRPKMMAIRNDPKLTDEQKRERRRALSEEQRRKLNAILTPQQRAKLAQARERRGFGGGGPMRLERLEKELNLTAAQKKKIEPIIADTRRKAEALRKQGERPGADRAAIRQQMRALQQSSLARVNKILTPQQQAKLRQAMPTVNREFSRSGR